MSKKVDTDAEKAFEQWLEGNSEIKVEETLKAIDEDHEWQERMNVAHKLRHHVEVTPEQEVPNWDRGSTFESDKTAWWQWQGLPAMSFAFSLFAMSMVLFKVEFIVQDEGIMLSFAGSNQQSQESKIAEVVDQKLQLFAGEQQVILANYAADIKVKQQESNLQLASYLMGASRQERKEDMGEFMKYISEQRADEQFDQNMKFKQLEQALMYQNTSIQNLGLQAKPANWTTEE